MASQSPQPQRSNRLPLIAALVVVLLGLGLLLTGAATAHHAYAWLGVLVLILGVIGIRVATLPHLGGTKR